MNLSFSLKKYETVVILHIYNFIDEYLKQISLFDLKGKFTKDFDTFGKMDPFLQFTVGKSFGKTEIATSAGKEPIWKQSVTLTYFDEAQITVKAYDDDATEKQFIGTGKLQIKSLKFPGGPLEITFLTDSGQYIGVVTGRYTVKNLPPVPMLLIKKPRLQLCTEDKSIMKSKPFLQFSTQQNSDATESKEQIKGLSICWTQNLRLKIKQSSNITISLKDKDNKQDYFIYECFVKQFRLQNGVKKFNVFNKKFQVFGVLHFDYQTLNLASKEESAKNIEREKKAQTQLTAIFIEKVSSQLKIQGKDIYFKLIVGTHNYTSNIFTKNQKVFTTQVKKTVYAEEKQNKLAVVFFSKDMIGESIVAYGHITLDSLLSGGSKKITLMNEEKDDMGNVTLNISHKKIPSRVMNIQNLALEVYEGGDLIGQSQPFIIAKIGSCSGSTQIGQSNRLKFKRGIQLRYFDEQFLEMQIWDQDLTMNQLLYTKKVKLSQLKNKGEHQIIYKIEKDGRLQTKAKLIFQYQIKNSIPQPPALKNSQVKNPEIQSPKKQVSTISAPIVAQPQKQKPKVAETKKIEDVQIKPPKKDQVQPPIQKSMQKEQALSIQKPLKTEESKPAPMYTQTIKTQPNQVLEKNNFQKGEQLKSKRDSLKKSLKTSGNRSKDSLLLPSIMNKIFGDKIYEKQSASTLQTSILAYSIPKASRFSALPKYSGEPTYCMDSCFKPNPTKGAGIGFGRKRQFPEWLERNMKENPSPGSYYDDRNNNTSKGPSFGLSYKYYQKVTIPKEQKTTSRAQISRSSKDFIQSFRRFAINENDAQ